MTFPASAINGQVTVVNGITYIFSASTTSWTRVPQIISNIGNLVSQTTLTVGGNIGVNIATPRATLDLGNTTGMMLLPTGGNSQRPATPHCGAIRFNTCMGAPEWYSGNNSVIIACRSMTIYTPGWLPFSSNVTSSVVSLKPTTYSINILTVAGGGSGDEQGGGGGAGGLLFYGCATSKAGSAKVVTTGTTQLTITVGGGGVWCSSAYSGGNSTVVGGCISITAIGGGAGNGRDQAPKTSANGGSGGGGGAGSAGGSSSGGCGTTGQGHNGASGGFPGGGGGGGGGAGAAGTAGSGSYTPTGGAGLAYTITGANVTYAGGGGGGGVNGYGCGGGAGGAGGGGGGSSTTGGGGSSSGVYSATPGTNTFGPGGTNTGGGGGGGGKCGPYAGGSGIVIISYPWTSQLGTGGCTITSYCNSGTKYWVHTFKSSGTYKA